MRKILKGNGEWGECTMERVNVRMLECLNEGLEGLGGLGGLECLDWKQLGQLAKTTF